jgi:spore coat protein JB
MRNREALMQVIRKYDFALYDLTLYLDTHTQCQEALALFRKYRSLRESAVAEYVKRFGPLQPLQNENETQWQWGKGPYPWEREAN